MVIAFALLVLLALPPASGQIAEKTSPYIREFKVPPPHLGPLAITHATGGNIWFTLDGSNALGVFQTSDNRFTIYNVPWKPTTQVRQYGMEGIAVDKIGNVWFSHSSTSRIGKFDPKAETFSGVVIRPNASVFRVLPDDSGNVWYSDVQNNMIGFVSPDGSVREFDIPTSKSGPAGLTFDSSGRLWFTETFAKKIGYFDLKTNEVIEFPYPREYVNSPVGISVQQDGIVWTSDHGGAAIVRFDPKSNTWKKFLTSRPPPEIYPISLPNDVVLDKNGYLWVAEHAGNKIARFDPRTEILTEYVIPSSPAITLWLTLDEKGNVWFAEAQAGKLGKLDISMSPSFSLNISTDAVTVRAGKVSNLSARIDVLRSGDPIVVSTYGFPNSINITASPRSITASSSSDLKVRLAHALDEGTYYFSISAGDGNVFQTRTLLVKVEADKSHQEGMVLFAIGSLAVTGIVIVVFAIIFNRLWKGPSRKNGGQVGSLKLVSVG